MPTKEVPITITRGLCHSGSNALYAVVRKRSIYDQNVIFVKILDFAGADIGARTYIDGFI